MLKRTSLACLCVFSLVACSGPSDNGTPPAQPPDDTSPGYYETQDTLNRLEAEGNLAAQAVKASGLYDDLATGNYPFLLMLVQSNDALEAYLAENGLSREEFLEHPKLRDFMEQHLIDSYVDVVKIRSTQNTRATYTSAGGSEVILTTGENLDPAAGDVMFANGVPVEAYCFVSGSGGEDDLQSKGLLCSADTPIVEFDWAE